MQRLLILLVGASILAAACGGGKERDPVAVGAPPASGGAEGEDTIAPVEAADPGRQAGAESVEGAYDARLRAAAQALEERIEPIAKSIAGAESSEAAFAGLQEAAPALVQALQAGLVDLEALTPPPELAADHNRLVSGVRELAALQEEIAGRLAAGDVAGVLGRADAAARRQGELLASLSTSMVAAEPFLGVAGALGFLPLAATEVTSAGAARLEVVETERYYAPLDYPGSMRTLSLDPLAINGVVALTARWEVAGSAPVVAILEFYEAALRALGAEGEANRFQTGSDAGLSVGAAHPFGSVIVMIGAGPGGAHVVTVTGSFPE